MAKLYRTPTIQEGGDAKAGKVKKLMVSDLTGTMKPWIPEEDAEFYITRKNKKITKNGTYKVSDETIHTDAWKKITVKVKPKVKQTMAITINGDYDAEDDPDYDGYRKINVNVTHKYEQTTIGENGTFTPEEGVDGFSVVVVDVHEPGPTPPPSPTGDTKPLTVTANGDYDVKDDPDNAGIPEGGELVVKGYTPVTVAVPSGSEDYAIVPSDAPVSTLPWSLSTPYECVVYNDKIHAFPGFFHYEWEGPEDPDTSELTPWTALTNATISNENCAAVVYGGKIHLIGGSNSQAQNTHRVWDEENGFQTLNVTMPYGFYGGSAVVYGGKIHILGNYLALKAHWTFDGTSWHTEAELPAFMSNYGKAVVYGNKIHIWCSDSTHYVYDGTSWEAVDETVDTNYWRLGNANLIVFDNKIFQIGYGNFFYSYDPETSLYRPEQYTRYYYVSRRIGYRPYEWAYTSANNGQRALLYRDRIHILGGYNSDTRTSHWTYKKVVKSSGNDEENGV